jgi:hypothetical protein
MSHLPEYAFGLPSSSWVTWFDLAYHTGRATDIQGRPIGQEFRGCTFAGIPYDEDDPPCYESEASYLDRLDLLTANERRRLPADAFEPEVITGDECWDEDALEQHRRREARSRAAVHADDDPSAS